MIDPLSAEAVEELRTAKRRLETKGFATRLMDLAGARIEEGFELLPAKLKGGVLAASETSLRVATRVAVESLAPTSRGSALDPRRWLDGDRSHQVAVTLAGGVGGAFGMVSLPIELPLTTLLMLRSIAQIGRAEGEDLGRPQAQLACVEVFALGGTREAGYLEVRRLLAREVTEAAKYLAADGVVDLDAPAIVRFIAKIAECFGVSVSERAVAMALPIVGALGGAGVNNAFISHYQSLAHGHFVVRRLERRFGEEAVRRAYAAL